LTCGIEASGIGIRIALMQLKPVPTVIHCEEIAMQPGDEPRIGGLVAKVLQKFGAPKADVHLVFSPPQPAPGRHYLFTAPKLSKSELIQVATRELKRDGTVDPNNAYYTVEALEQVDTEGGVKGQRYLLVALAKEPVDVAAVSLLDSKLVVRSATTSAMGLLRTLNITDMPATGVVAVAQLDIRRSTLLVLENGVPRFFRDIPTSFAKGGREGANDALIAQALARELDISLVFFAQQFRPKQVDTIMIVGDAEVADRVSEWLEESQSYRVVRFATNPKLKTAPNTPANLQPFAAAIGAALGGRGGPASDLLPAELRGRPERVIATIIGAVSLLLIMAVVMQLRSVSVRKGEEVDAALTTARSRFVDVQRKVTEVSALDEDTNRADRWQTFFEQTDLYHKKLGNLLFQLHKTVPPKAQFTVLLLQDIPGVRPPPAPGKRDYNEKLVVSGWARQTDQQAAQGDILSLFRAVQAPLTPDIGTATLAPIAKSALTTEVGLPFYIDAQVAMPFPGPKR
jgi:hypothetical protein